MNSSFIKFSNKLTKHGSSTITYSGFLFENNSESVSIVYGYGNSWANTEEKVMEKTPDGFKVEIKLLNEDYDKFNFCFKNENNIYDNNNFANYTATILEPVYEAKFILNEDVVTDIINGMLDIKVEPVEFDTTPAESNVVEFDTTPTENIDTETFDGPEYFEVEYQQIVPTTFEDEVTSVEDASSLNHELDIMFSELYSESEESSNVEYSEEKQNLLEDIIKPNVETKVVLDDGTIETTTKQFDMNALIDEILAPISEVSTKKELKVAEPVQTIQVEEKPVETPVDVFEPIDVIKEAPVEAEVSVANIQTTDSVIDDEDLIVDEKISNLLDSIYANVNEVVSKMDESNIEIETENVQTVVNDIPDDYDMAERFKELSQEIDSVEQEITQEIDLAETEIPMEQDESAELNKELTKEIDTVVDELNNEVSLIEDYEESAKADETSLVDLSEDKFIVSSKALGPFYLFKKRIKLALYKLVTAVPKMLGVDFSDNENK